MDKSYKAPFFLKKILQLNLLNQNVKLQTILRAQGQRHNLPCRPCRTSRTWGGCGHRGRWPWQLAAAAWPVSRRRVWGSWTQWGQVQWHTFRTRPVAQSTATASCLSLPPCHLWNAKQNSCRIITMTVIHLSTLMLHFWRKRTKKCLNYWPL